MADYSKPKAATEPVATKSLPLIDASKLFKAGSYGIEITPELERWLTSVVKTLNLLLKDWQIKEEAKRQHLATLISLINRTSTGCSGGHK